MKHMRVLILGAGGHAQVVADILMKMKEKQENISIGGYLDDNPRLQGQVFLGVRVIGALSDLADTDHDAVIAALGDNRTRCEVFRSLHDLDQRFLIARHPYSQFGAEVTVGEGSMICSGVTVNPASYIGANVILNTGCSVDHHNYVGAHAHIAPGVHTGGGVVIGEGTLVGIGSTVLPGCRIGCWAVIGAGAVVARDIPDGVLAMGVPARVVRKLSSAGSVSDRHLSPDRNPEL